MPDAETHEPAEEHREQEDAPTAPDGSKPYSKDDAPYGEEAKSYGHPSHDE